MNPNRPFNHVPRRVLNIAVIVGGLTGIFLQTQFNWDTLTTFLITLGLCGLCVVIVSVVFSLFRRAP
jgi:uncharacterized membrane protein YqgA involved in biofilm formation